MPNCQFSFETLKFSTWLIDYDMPDVDEVSASRHPGQTPTWFCVAG